MWLSSPRQGLFAPAIANKNTQGDAGFHVFDLRTLLFRIAGIANRTWLPCNTIMAARVVARGHRTLNRHHQFRQGGMQFVTWKQLPDKLVSGRNFCLCCQSHVQGESVRRLWDRN